MRELTLGVQQKFQKLISEWELLEVISYLQQSNILPNYLNFPESGGNKRLWRPKQACD